MTILDKYYTNTLPDGKSSIVHSSTARGHTHYVPLLKPHHDRDHHENNDGLLFHRVSCVHSAHMHPLASVHVHACVMLQHPVMGPVRDMRQCSEFAVVAHDCSGTLLSQQLSCAFAAYDLHLLADSQKRGPFC